MTALDQLRELIEGDHHCERDCRQFLAELAEHLCQETPERIIEVGYESVSEFGSADFYVIADISDGARKLRKAYVWELKSPQSPILEFDDHKERLRPTKPLIKAETQLFHYVESFSNSDAWRRRHQIQSPSDVVACGIIIGRKSSCVITRGDLSSEATLGLYDVAINVRWKFLYRHVPLRLYTWDWVLDRLRIRAELERGDAFPT